MKRLLIAFTILLGTGILLGAPAHPQNRDVSTNEGQLLDVVRKHITYREATVSFERNGDFYVEISDLSRDLPVQVYRKSIRSTDEGKRLVEKSLGTGKLVVEGPELARLILDDTPVETLSLGDQVRTKPFRLDLVNRSQRDSTRLQSLLLKHRGIDEVRTVEQRAEARRPYLLIESSGARLFLENEQQPTATVDWRQRSSEESSREPNRPTFRDRARFDRTVNDFEWIRLPTRSPIQLIALAGEGFIGFARFEDEVTGIHWLDVPGKVLDVSIRHVSSDNPGKIYFLAVLKQNGSIRSQAYSFNALDRTLRKQWTANDRWMRKTTDGRYFSQKIGLNVPFSSQLLETDVSGDGWTTVSGGELTVDGTIISPGYAADSSVFAYLDGSGRLHLRRKSGDERTLAPEFGGDPRSVSARRNDRSRSLQPEFALNTSGDSIHLFLPRNIAGGVSFIRGLRSYKQSRLFLLDAGGRTVDTLWESNLQPGYVSATEFFEGSYWAVVVDPSEERSRLKEVQYPPES